MHTWASYISNAKTIRDCYETPPLLCGLGIYDLIFSIDNEVFLTVGISNMPYAEKIPPNWINRKYNRCSMKVLFLNVRNVICIGSWSDSINRHEKTSITFERDASSEIKVVIASSKEFYLSFVTPKVFIKNLSGYQVQDVIHQGDKYDNE